MKFDVVSDSIDHISQEAIDSSATSLIPQGSVLIVVRSGILARTVPIAVAGRDLTINQDLKALCPNGSINSQFLYYLLHSKMDELLAMVSRGATVHRLMTEHIRSLEFVLPSLSEQLRIVGILDEAFDGIATAKANTEKNLQNAGDLFQSYVQSVFTQRGEGWVQRRLEECGVIKTGKRDANHQTENGDYPFFTCAVGQFRSPTFAFDGASIILPGNGANVGRVFFYDGKFEAYQRTYVVNELKAAINPRFLFYHFNAGWSAYIANKQFGSATNYIVVGDLKAFPVPVPPASVQMSIVEHFDSLFEQTKRLESTYERKLAALDALKKSLLHEAFSGRL